MNYSVKKSMMKVPLLIKLLNFGFNYVCLNCIFPFYLIVAKNRFVYLL